MCVCVCARACVRVVRACIRARVCQRTNMLSICLLQVYNLNLETDARPHGFHTDELLQAKLICVFSKQNAYVGRITITLFLPVIIVHVLCTMTFTAHARTCSHAYTYHTRTHQQTHTRTRARTHTRTRTRARTHITQLIKPLI